MKTKLKLLTLAVLAPIAIFLAVISGCDDSTTNTPIYVDNPNVKTFDSIGVDEDSAAFQSYTGIDLLAGRTTIDTAGSRDCSLNDVNNTGADFYLQNGELLNNLLASGYEIRFFRVSSDMSVTTFDTLSKVPGYTSFVPNDFTQNGTENWGYFYAPFVLGSSAPVFCFWLKGKKDANITLKDVYGIIQPREATDMFPGQPYGYRMSFRVRININAENDFRKQILQQ
jgi:hypothetical protein